jgi:hypothetical protein
LVCCLAGCNPAAKISLVDFGPQDFYGIRSVHGKALVESRAEKTLVIENATVVLRYKSRELSTRLMLPIEIPPGERTWVRYDLKLDAVSLSDLQTVLRRMEQHSEQLLVDVRAQVRYGGIRRTIEMKDIPYSEFYTNYLIPAHKH